MTCAAPATPARGLPTLDLTAMPTSDSLHTSDDFQTRPVVSGNRKASPPSQGLQAPASAVSALPKQISYSELTRDRQSGQQPTQPERATESSSSGVSRLLREALTGQFVTWVVSLAGYVTQFAKERNRNKARAERNIIRTAFCFTNAYG